MYLCTLSYGINIEYIDKVINTKTSNDTEGTFGGPLSQRFIIII